MKQVGERDPERLELSDPTLKRALSALGDAGPSEAELQRMRQRLMGVLEAPAPSRLPRLRLVRGPLAGLLVGAVLAGVISLMLARREPEERSAFDVPRDETEEADPSVDFVEPTPARAEPNERVPSPIEVVRASEHPALAKSRRVHAVASRAPNALDTTQLAAPSGETMAATTDTDTKNEATAAPPMAAPSPEPAAAHEAKAPAENPPSSTRAPAPAPPDEASLLQRARRLAASDREAALRVLDEHRQRFAHGMLTPEREVLAIELLRALSRREEAAKRLSDFRRNFPDSVYLQRLAR